MPIEFRMPSLGPDMEAGTLVAWQIKPGDSVKRGDVVAQVETDKGIIDVEIFTDGKIERLIVEQGARVPIGAVLALLSGEAVSAATISPVTETTSTPGPPNVERRGLPVSKETSAHRARISPAARTHAHALGIDVETIVGTGLGGVIGIADVERAAKSRAEVPAASAASNARPDVRPDMRPDMRQVIGRAMSRSKQEIPHYYLTLNVNFSAARTWLDAHNKSVAIVDRILPVTLLVKAVALAAHDLPDFNGYYEKDFVHASQVNVGVAIAMRGGRLVAPAILETDTKPLPALMRELRDLTSRVRNGHMRSAELSQATITVTSLAEDGPDSIQPIIHPPQVAIVGFGSIAERALVIDGAVKAAPSVNITLAADHRVTDGRAGSRFLALIRDRLQTPESL